MKCLTLMRPPVAKRQKIPVSGPLSTIVAGDSGGRSCELTSFPCAGAAETHLYYRRIEGSIAPSMGDCRETMRRSPAALKPYVCPHAVLVNEGAAP